VQLRRLVIPLALVAAVVAAALIASAPRARTTPARHVVPDRVLSSHAR
jgi:hypothetical protein